jgi:hypothetical protein
MKGFTVSENRKNPKVVTDPAVREVYANKLISTTFDGGSIVLTLGVTRVLPNRVDEAPDANAVPNCHVTSMIALSPAASIEVVNGLGSMISMIQSGAAAKAAAVAQQQQRPPVKPN